MTCIGRISRRCCCSSTCCGQQERRPCSSSGRTVTASSGVHIHSREILADFRRDESVTRLSLRGLTATDVQGLAPSIAGHSVPSGLAALVVEGAGGNPFFIGEILRHLRETDAFSDVNHDVDLGLPEGVKEVIGRRLSRLSEECNRALALAAVIGREFDVELLVALGDLPEDRLLDAIDEAVRAQLIAEVVGGRSRLTFRHALIRETLYGELLSARRVRLHRRVAEAIEQKARGRTNPPLADLAYHFSQSASAGYGGQGRRVCDACGRPGLRVVGIRGSGAHVRTGAAVDRIRRRTESGCPPCRPAYTPCPSVWIAWAMGR